MAAKRDFPIRTQNIISVVDAKLSVKIQEFQLRLGALASGYPVLTDWHPLIPEEWGSYSQVPFQRSVVYKGNAETWAYSHEQAITRFGDKLVVSWSNGLVDEDYPGQEVHFAWSTDGTNWSEPQVIVPTPLESKLIRNNAGLYAENGRLYSYIGVTEDSDWSSGSASMNRLDGCSFRLDIYETVDLENWTHHEGVCPDVYL